MPRDGAPPIASLSEERARRHAEGAALVEAEIMLACKLRRLSGLFTRAGDPPRAAALADQASEAVGAAQALARALTSLGEDDAAVDGLFAQAPAVAAFCRGVRADEIARLPADHRRIAAAAVALNDTALPLIDRHLADLLTRLERRHRRAALAWAG